MREATVVCMQIAASLASVEARRGPNITVGHGELAHRLGFRTLLTFGIHIHASTKHEKRALLSVKAYANTVSPEHKYNLNI